MAQSRLWEPCDQREMCKPGQDACVPISRQDTKGTVCFKPLFILLLVRRRLKAAHPSREAATKSDACLILKGVTDIPRDRVQTGYSKGWYLSWTLPGHIRQTRPVEQIQEDQSISHAIPIISTVVPITTTSQLQPG